VRARLEAYASRFVGPLVRWLTGVRRSTVWLQLWGLFGAAWLGFVIGSGGFSFIGRSRYAKLYLYHTVWQVISVETPIDGAATPPPGALLLSFPEDMLTEGLYTVDVVTPCRHLTAAVDWDLRGSSVLFSQMGSPQGSCPEPGRSQDAYYTAMLRATTGWSVLSDSEFVLHGRAGDLRFRIWDGPISTPWPTETLPVWTPRPSSSESLPPTAFGSTTQGWVQLEERQWRIGSR
jgi:hypothetical protein